MTRSTPPIAAALATATALALALTACGSDAKPSDKISGVPTTAPTTAPTTPSASAPEPGAPTFKLPADVKVKIDGFESTDATKKAVLRDTSYAITAILEAEAMASDKETPNFKRYFTGLHGAEFADTIIKYGKDGNVITGSYRYYKPTANVTNASSATATYCEDQRNGYDKDRKTGKVKKNAPSPQDYSLWSLVLAKGTTGDWQVFSYDVKEGAKECQSS
ncbi:hypothetical protein G3I60_10415 [Streptomyces sp. SID13666]|uniref:hypothetical protein n=1 Tax=unclassified Streptomyces TaxID=2593676 RepID=UPI0013C02EDC|nr:MULTISPECIES: hypothetical protein [unclassified Streptomyces]MCZ4101522.1 hypothetical protein [Streptomyces sp. H39-C1]NEA54554.1 hypothetical protein [Streptomyces sp. SID13666]NEA74375.1 hypothetical protein [Streptomyces sp. SID13588]